MVLEDLARHVDGLLLDLLAEPLVLVLLLVVDLQVVEERLDVAIDAAVVHVQPYPQIAFYRDYATGAGYVASGVTFRDVGTALKVRASLLPDDRLRAG